MSTARTTGTVRSRSLPDPAADPAAVPFIGPLTGQHPERPEDLRAHQDRLGRGTGPHPAALLAALAEADLRGRGGAGFPTAAKLAAVRDNALATGSTPIAVANGEEGEPGSAKDRYLLRYRPHLVLDGLSHACRIIGARRAHVYVSDPVAAGAVRTALAERLALDPLPETEIDVVEVEHSYVAGEESAVVRFLDGGPALPTAKPPRAYQHGVGGVPTLVSNVETLAQIALVAAGLPADTRLVTVTTTAAATATAIGGFGAVRELYEVPRGTSLRDLATAHLGATGAGRLRAVMVGGLFGGIHGPDALDLLIDPAPPVTAGARVAPGCAAIRLIGPEECPVDVVAEALGFLAEQSSRQCGVCVSGTRALSETVARATRGTATRADRDALTRWAQLLPGRGACGLLDAAAGLAGTLAANFPDLLDAHTSALGAPVPGTGPATCTN